MSEKTFRDLLSSEMLLKNLEETMGFKAPTPIQAAVGPTILEGRDLLAGAKTGSGKTVAFLAPTIERMVRGEIKAALVLSPTRELVLQIDEEAMKLLDGQSKINAVPLYGGVPIDPQILAIKHHKPRLFIATPGRMIDFAQEDILPFQDIEMCVLDEADRMCDMGFAPQVTQILDYCPNKKQMLLFSATLPKELNEIMMKFCNDPVRIQVDAADKASDTIVHHLVQCRDRDKLVEVHELLTRPNMTSLIFTKTRKRADSLYKALRNEVKGLGVLHAGFSMPDRERTIRAFRSGELEHLIATDVVSRGIDVERISQVLHYDLPETFDEYIHRSGRAGRAGRAGSTYVLIDPRSRVDRMLLEPISKNVKFEGADLKSAPREYAPSRDQGPRRHRSEGRRQGSGGGRGRSHEGRGDHRGDHRNEHRGNRQTGQVHQKSHRVEHKKKSSPGSKLISKTKSLIRKVFGRSKTR